MPPQGPLWASASPYVSCEDEGVGPDGLQVSQLCTLGLQVGWPAVLVCPGLTPDSQCRRRGSRQTRSSPRVQAVSQTCFESSAAAVLVWGAAGQASQQTRGRSQTWSLLGRLCLFPTANTPVPAPPHGLALSGMVPREQERQCQACSSFSSLVLFPSIVVIITTKRQSPAWGQQRELF